MQATRIIDEQNEVKQTRTRMSEPVDFKNEDSLEADAKAVPMVQRKVYGDGIMPTMF